MNELWRIVRDPRVSTFLLLAAVCLTGLALVGLGWRGGAATLSVPLQLPFLVSGGLAGVALTGAGLGFLRVHADRVEGAEERQAYADLQRETLLLLALAHRTTQQSKE